MRFIDEAKIKIAGGHGGPGCISFKRETFMPRGGPDGGDGGKGGGIILIAHSQLSTLQDFRFKRIYQAPRGMHGSGSNKTGSDGDDIEIKIPVGTIIKDAVTGEVLRDFTLDGETWVVCKGGRGGKGNAHFVTSTFQAPRFAQPGEDGESREIILELKLLADVGIIGFPNAGKSTLISKISAAKPKIADYPFTTLVPNLGVVAREGIKPFVVADIPGLVEGAHSGKGLGHKFLKHIERTRVFLHVLDGTALLDDATEPDADSFNQAIERMIARYQAIRNELGLFSEALLHKPEIVVMNKVDLFEADPELIARAQTALRQRIASIRGTHPAPGEPFVISAVSGNGLETLLFCIQTEIETQRTLHHDPNSDLKLPDHEGVRT